MLRVLIAVFALCLAAGAAERTFDFSQTTNANDLPKGFRSTVSGEGKPGEWKLILDDVTSALPTLSPRSPVRTKQSVLAQLARDRTDEHFPLLVLDDETFGDFTFKTRFKTMAGEAEQMAGVVFRLQDEKNYYVVRASSLGNNLRFYKFVNGVRSSPIGPELPIPTNVWHELTVECKGNQIRVLLNGKEVMPALSDSSFPAGKIGFWTKSDSVSYFADARLSYTLREKLADGVVHDTLNRFTKLKGLKLFAMPAGKDQPLVIASGNRSEIGQPGGEQEKKCLLEGAPFVGRGKDTMAVMLPLRDRNGDIVAAARVTLDSFLGQTENNALARVRPVLKFMENRVANANETLQ